MALGPQQEVHLADAEVVEVEAQLGRDVFVGHLFMRQHDVQPMEQPPASRRRWLPASITPGRRR